MSEDELKQLAYDIIYSEFRTVKHIPRKFVGYGIDSYLYKKGLTLSTEELSILEKIVRDALTILYKCEV